MPSKYTYQEMVAAFKKVGIVKGDVVFVSTSLGMLGLLEGAKSNDELNAGCFNALCDVVGEEGTVVVPTYSYTFGKSRTRNLTHFDVKKTPSEIGPFPEYFRQQADVIRTTDPFMSVAIKGKLATVLSSDLPHNSYGHDCLFARLRRKGTKCLNIGLGPNWMAFIHHIEYLHNVPFRYDKSFVGLMDGRQIDWVYPVPVWDEYAVANAHSIARSSEEMGLWQTESLGRARVYACDYDEYFDYVDTALSKDPWCLATGEARDVLLAERSRIKALGSDLAQDVAICLAANNQTEALADHFGLEVQRQLTGQYVNDTVVPEGWFKTKLVIKAGEKLMCDDAAYIYPYSLPFKGSVSGSELKRAIVTIPYQAPSSFRDWSLKPLPFTIDEQTEYIVEIESGFYKSELISASKLVEKSNEIHVYLTLFVHPEKLKEEIEHSIKLGVTVLVASYEHNIYSMLKEAQKASPHRCKINISQSLGSPYLQLFEEQITELVEKPCQIQWNYI